MKKKDLSCSASPQVDLPQMAKVLWEYKITDKPADPNEDKDDEGKSWLDILRTAEPIRWLTQREIDAIISERENPEDP